MGAQKLSKGSLEYTERIFIIVVAYSRGKVQWRNFYPRSTGTARLQKSAFAKMRGRIVEVPGGAMHFSYVTGKISAAPGTRLAMAPVLNKEFHHLSVVKYRLRRIPNDNFKNGQ